MKPYELIAALMHREGGSLRLAKKMGKPELQSNFHKFAAGNVANPRITTALPLATYFKIPVEAIYDEKVATQVASERDISALPAAILAAKKPAKKQGAAVDKQAARLAEQYMKMSPVERQRLELLMHVARDGKQPPAKWRRPDADPGAPDVGTPEGNSGFSELEVTPDQPPAYGNQRNEDSAFGGLEETRPATKPRKAQK